MASKITIGLLVLVILSTSMYVIFNERVMIDVQKTRTLYSVCEEPPCKYNYQYTHAGTEYVNLFDGTTKMRASSRELNRIQSGNTIIDSRISKWKDNITTIQTYIYDAQEEDIEKVPLKNIVECINCEGKILHFEFRDLAYSGPTRTATSPESFGHNIKIEWQDGYEWAKVYQQKSSDKLVIRYKPKTPHAVFKVRLFDPILNNSNTSVTINKPVNETTYLSPIDFNATANATVDLCKYSVNDGANVTFYNRTCFQAFANVSTGCGGLATGSYTPINTSDWNGAGSSDPDHLIDGIITTCAYATSPNVTGYVEVNISKPDGVNASSKLSAYLAFNDTVPPPVRDSERNFTFGEYTDCWDAYSGLVRVRAWSNNTVVAENIGVECYNGTGWEVMFNETKINDVPWVCEIQMRWNLVDIPETTFNSTFGSHNVTAYCLDTNNDWSQAPYIFFTINDTPVFKVNPDLNESPAQNYGINWTVATSNLNYSDQTVIAGNFTYNISQENISIFPFNTSWLFNITNQFAVSITISLEQNQTSEFYHWWCLNGSIKQWNITDTLLSLFTLSPGESYYLNCTLDVFNISRSCTQWNCTQAGTWDFDYNFSAG